MSTATVFEQAKRMLYTEERVAAPLHYLALTDKLTPPQRHFLLQESEFIRLAPEPLKEAKRRLYNGRQRKPGGGRKQLGTRPEYVAALERVMVLQSSASPLAYSIQSASDYPHKQSQFPQWLHGSFPPNWRMSGLSKGRFQERGC